MGAESDAREIERLCSLVDHLREALVSRDVIGQAKGRLMERHRISADEAFERLVRISQGTNTKLRDVAARVAGGGGAAAARRERDDVLRG